MSKLSPTEVQHLSDLLISEDENNVALGLQLLQNNPEHVEELFRELILVDQLQSNEEHQVAAHLLLSQVFSKRQISLRRSPFKLFKHYNSVYEQNSKLQKMIKSHEKWRPKYEALIVKNSLYTHFYFQVARQFRWHVSEQWDLAETYFKIALSVHPYHKDYLFNMAFMLHKIPGRHFDAIHHYEQILTTNPKDSPAIHNIGHIYQYQVGDNQKAFAYYARALSLDPQKELYMQNMALLCVYAMEGDEHKAMAKTLLQQLLEIDPNSGDYWDNWAYYSWMVEGNYEETERAYLKGLELDPFNDSLLGNLAELYADIYKDYVKALNYYKKSIKIRPSPYFLVNMIALCVLELKDFEEAIVQYKKLLAVSEKQPIKQPYSLPEKEWKRFLRAEKILVQQFPDLIPNT